MAQKFASYVNNGTDQINFVGNSYYVVGTQTSATNAWTGAMPGGLTDYYDGLTIDYFLPYAGTSTAATLNLGGLGAKPIYRGNGIGSVTTHFPAYSIIRLTYVINANLNGGVGCWKVTAYYDSDTHYTTHLYAGAKDAIANSTVASDPYLLICDNSTNRNSVQIKGSGATSVSAASGVITISSTNTTYSEVTTTTAGLMSAADKVKLNGIAASANNYTYTLPVATSDALGGIKIGFGTNSANRNYAVQLDSNNKAYVNVPWSDTNTQVTVENVLTSSSTVNALSAAQGAALKTLIDGKAASSHTHNYAGSTSAGGAANSVKASLSFGNKTYNGSSAQTITAADLNIINALQFIGTTTTDIATTPTTTTITLTSGTTKTMASSDNGNVVVYNNNSYWWNGSSWEKIGTGDGGVYKIVQEAYNSSSPVTNKWLSYISQDTNGNIEATLSSLDTSGTWSGVAGSANKLNSNAGSATNPIYFSNGVPAACTYSLKATVNNATQYGVAYYSTTTNLTSTAAGAANTALMGKGSAAPAFVSVNPSQTWANGTTSGPTLSISVLGVASTATAIPVASVSYSGVVSTGAQTFGGVKTFNSEIKASGNIRLINGSETDRFVIFDYDNDNTSGASWRIGALNSGSGDTNYFAFQTGTSDTSATTWNTALKLGMNTYDATFSGNVVPSETNKKTLGTSSLKWSNVYATTFTGALSGNATTADAFSSAASISLSGDVTGSASSTKGWSITTTLADSGVSAGSYGPSANVSPAHGKTFTVPYITVDAKGRITSASTTTITLPTDNNNYVNQSATTTSSWRKILMHYTADSTSTAAVTSTTNVVYGAIGISAQPSTGTLRATAYNVADGATISYDSTNKCLNFVFA